MSEPFSFIVSDILFLGFNIPNKTNFIIDINLPYMKSQPIPTTLERCYFNSSTHMPCLIMKTSHLLILPSMYLNQIIVTIFSPITMPRSIHNHYNFKLATDLEGTRFSCFWVCSRAGVPQAWKQ